MDRKTINSFVASSNPSGPAIGYSFLKNTTRWGDGRVSDCGIRGIMKNENTKFTPGPWEVSEVIPGTGRRFVGALNRKIAVAEIILPEDTENMANAALIAASPELLFVLKQGEDIISGLEAQADNAGLDLSEARAWWQQARAAIAKAEGK